MAQSPLFLSQYNPRNILNLPEYWELELIRWVKLWIQDLQAGIHPATAQTVRTHRARFIRYTRYIYEQQGEKLVSLAHCMEISNLCGRISAYPIESYSNRHSTFFALRSFAQFLIKLGPLEEGYLLKIKPLRPKRVVPAKRTVLRDKEMLEKFRSAIQKEHYESEWSYLTVKTIMETLIQTGLRSSELAGLKFADVDLEKSRLAVYMGKGRKSRVIGIPKSLSPLLTVYLEQRQKMVEGESFFLNGK